MLDFCLRDPETALWETALAPPPDVDLPSLPSARVPQRTLFGTRPATGLSERQLHAQGPGDYNVITGEQAVNV